jgi:hypothetical protein
LKTERHGLVDREKAQRDTHSQESENGFEFEVLLSSVVGLGVCQAINPLDEDALSET